MILNSILATDCGSTTTKAILIEKVKVLNIAKKFKTPIYCYSYRQLKENINSFKKNFH